MEPQQHGFTLIEIAVVLVIVGLLASGILVGRDLIEAAEIRRQISSIREIDTGVLAFRDKYQCLPGDCTDAVDLGFYEGGDGDGVVRVRTTVEYAAGETWNESACFWVMLGELGMLSGVPNPCNRDTFGNLPTAECGPPFKLASQGRRNPSLTGGGGPPPPAILPFEMPPSLILRAVETPDTNFSGIQGRHYYWLTNCTGRFRAWEAGCAIYSPARTQAIDTKMDDGLPMTGKVVARSDRSAGTFGGPANAIPGPGGPSASRCVSDALPPTYNVANTSLAQASLCSLTVESSF